MVSPVERSEEGGDTVGVEVTARTSFELVPRIVFGKRAAVRPVLAHRPVCVADGHDPGAERDRPASEPVGIAGAVPALVVVPHDGEDRL